jgi:hypothetical protein
MTKTATKNSRRKKPRVLAVIDTETDPFLYGRIPKPFAVGVRIGDVYLDFWGEDCIDRALDWIAEWDEPLIVYAHNGGKFDFFFMLHRIENPIKIINGRIVKAKFGIHEFRDSFAIMPQALSAYKKDEINYDKFDAEVRESHRAEILKYLRGDCNYLYEMCAAFIERFGIKLTIASTAMGELKKIHPQQNGTQSHDAKFRPFYFGGRVECFESGILRDDWKVYDVNSMYPHVMKNFDHPLGLNYVDLASPRVLPNGDLAELPGCMYFCEVEGWNRGTLPVRLDDVQGSLSFNQSQGVFMTTSHELRAALLTDSFTVKRIRRALVPLEVQRFAEFIDHFTEEKIACELAGDKIGRYFAKTIMNSSYGKFGQSPEEFADFYIQVLGRDDAPHPNEFDGVVPREGQHLWEMFQSDDAFCVWKKKAPGYAYFDVAIAASITGAARAELMLAIKKADRPAYCDTDSLICRGLSGVAIHQTELGAWKVDADKAGNPARGDRLAIAGKKLYALFDGARVVKAASKGVKLQADDIVRIAQGETLLWKSDAPNFSLIRPTRFVDRRVRATS